MTMSARPGDDWPDSMEQIARAAGLSDGADAVLRVLRWLPLASGDDLAGVMGRPVFGVLADLRRLRGAGLVESAQLGCTRRQRQRWFLSQMCLERARLSGATWHDEAARVRLVELLPAVEQLYPALGSVKGMGALREFQWLDATGEQGPSCDAAALYEGGWVALFWCGSLLSETILADRLERFPLDCQDLAVQAIQPWPSQVHLVVADEWERELALRVLFDFEMDRMAAVRCLADGTVTRPAHVRTSLGWVYQPVKHRSGRTSWQELLAESLWAGAGGLECNRALKGVVQWPGAHLRFLKGLLGEPPAENRIRQSIGRLVNAGCLLVDGEGQNARYFASGRGLNLQALQDRVHHLHARSSSGLSQWQEASPRQLRHTVSKPHEDGLRAMLRPFAALAIPLANGTRHEEKLGSGGGIAPDAMLYLRKSPYDKGWHYVEYERSARGRSRVSGKLRGYSSSRRRDSYPVILVCWDDDAERTFQEQGRELGISMVTTSLDRLKDHGPVGTTQCWSMYGEPVELG